MAPSQIVKEDEAAALAAMFKVQSENWEEAQERMSQLVLPPMGFHLCTIIQSNEFTFCFLSDRDHLPCYMRVTLNIFVIYQCPASRQSTSFWCYGLYERRETSTRG